MPSASQFLLKFLRSIGRRQDAEYYLQLFRQHPKSGFAVVAAEPEVFEQAPRMVVEPLRFLSRLGLYPALAVGVLGPSSPSTAARVAALLREEGTAAVCLQPASANWVAEAANQLNSERAVVIDFSQHQADADLATLLLGLRTRKFVVLRSQGGLGPKEHGRLSLTQSHHLITSESGISVINLRRDCDALIRGGYLADAEVQLLSKIRELHDQVPELLTSVASPLNLLRELFTVRGAGTLLKTGSTIETHAGYADLDLGRLQDLLESTFDRRLSSTFLARPVLNVYLEQNYRGAAIVQPGVDASFLTKFAVNRAAQGEGIGRDLWEAMLHDHPRVYWRGRTNNPIAPWYQSECDGMQKQAEWTVYWRGIDADQIPRVVVDALSREQDFERPS